MDKITITNFRKVGERFCFLGIEMIVMYVQQEKTDDRNVDDKFRGITPYLTASYKNKNDEMCSITFDEYHINALLAENKNHIDLYANYYSEETLADLDRDISEAVDSTFNSQMTKIPDGADGGFVVKLYWVPN